MSNLKKEINLFFLSKMKIGDRIMDKYGRIETIYGVEDGGIGKYVSTITTDDVSSPIFRTYFIKDNDENNNTLEKVAEKKEKILKNLKKATIEDIETNIGLDYLASQLN